MASDDPARQPPEEEKSQTDWLSRLRGKSEDEPDEAVEPEKQFTDWLTRLRDQESLVEDVAEPQEQEPEDPTEKELLRERLLAATSQEETEEQPEGWTPPPTSRLEFPSLQETAAPPPPAGFERVPDWLREEGETYDEEDEGQWQPPETSTLRMPHESFADLDSPFEIPDWFRAVTEESDTIAPTEDAEDDLPEWLRKSTSQLSPEQAKPATGPIGTGELPGWLDDETADELPTMPITTGELPSWLTDDAPTDAGSVDELGVEEQAEASVEPALEPPPAAEEAEQEKELPTWVAAKTPAEPTDEDVPAVPDTLEQTGELPDWLQESSVEEDIPDWLRDEEPSTSAADEMPEWLSAEVLAGEEQAAEAPQPPLVAETDEFDLEEPVLEEPVEEIQPEAEQPPDWLDSILPAEQRTETPPQDSEEEVVAEQPSLPEETETEAQESITPFFTESEALPEEAPTDTPPATPTPVWLEKLRAFDGNGAAALEADADYQEAAGPLAGMRGVLRAEPLISLPGKPGDSISRIAISDWQEKQARLLYEMMEQEIEDAVPEPHRRFRLSFALDRGIVYILIVLAVLVPLFVEQTYFDPPQPAQFPAEQALFNTINSLPANAPVLVAFDYDPGFSGEVGTGIDSVLLHLLQNENRLALVSTKPSGTGVAQLAIERALAELVRDAAAEYGVTYVNLGYVPGGAIGLQSFVSAPQATIRTDFVQAASPWEMEVLADVETFGQFALVIIASDSPTYSRAWLEQVQPRGVPLAAVVSAAADPLIQPYYQAPEPQLVGALSGLRGAFAYDLTLGRNSPPAAQRWEIFSAGIAVAALVFLLGNLVWGALGLQKRLANSATSSGAARAKRRPQQRSAKNES